MIVGKHISDEMSIAEHTSRWNKTVNHKWLNDYLRASLSIGSHSDNPASDGHTVQYSTTC